MVGINANGEALFEGEIKSTQGDIGGWKINDNSIYHSTFKDGYSTYNFSIDSEESRIIAKKIERVPKHTIDGYEYSIFYDDTLTISPGRLKYLNQVIDDEYGDIIEESSLFCIEDGALCISHHFGTTGIKPSDKIYISATGVNFFRYDSIDDMLKRTVLVNSSGIYVAHGNSSEERAKEHGINYLRGFREYGKPLKELYSVVTTGENSLVNKEAETIPWIQKTASFGVIYESEPLVNVLFYGSLPDHENIVFKEYIVDSMDGYTGFKYMVRTKDPEFNYRTKWWAVGNVKP